jgi:hypothetical protein
MISSPARDAGTSAGFCYALACALAREGGPNMSIAELPILEFERSRGIVWVCDVVKSSTYLNDNKLADNFEEFLHRLHWTSALAIEVVGGKFSKWTGDGFLGWFETPLHRNLETQAQAIFAAAWHLTVFLNVTQLGLKSSKKFTVRHGITYELDALVTKTKYPRGDFSFDVTGRNVVLAFRIQEGPSDFPGITTQRERVEASKGRLPAGLQFRHWRVNRHDLLKHFKGERRGTRALYVSIKEAPRKKTAQGTLRYSKKVLALAERKVLAQEEFGFPGHFLMAMDQGPQWARESVKEYLRYLKEDVIGSIKLFVSWMEERSPEFLSRLDEPMAAKRRDKRSETKK